MTSIELRRGETTPAGRLFEEYSDRLLGYCLRRLGSRSEAEDAVQTTFLHAHRALRRGVVPESEAAWLFTIAKNVCRWQQRTASRRGELASKLDTESLATPERDNAEEELLVGLDEALASMPKRQRQAILLREWRGLSCPEIASRLDLSPPATHALLTRARRSLACALTTAARWPALGLDLGSFHVQLRGLLSGSTAKVAATAVAIACVGVGGVGGVAVERNLVEKHSTLVSPAAGHESSGFVGGFGDVSDALVGGRSGAVRRVSTESTPVAPRSLGARKSAFAPDAPRTAPPGAAAASGSGPAPSNPLGDGVVSTTRAGEDVQDKPLSDLPVALLLPEIEAPVEVEPPPVSVSPLVPSPELPTADLPPVPLPAVPDAGATGALP